MSQHHLWDLINGGIFLVGICLFFLAKSGALMRQGKLKTRREFLYENWDSMLIRVCVFDSMVFWGWRHVDFQAVLKNYHISPLVPIAPWFNSWIAALVVGFFSDAIVAWALSSSLIPVGIRTVLNDELPPLPQGPQK